MIRSFRVSIFLAALASVPLFVACRPQKPAPLVKECPSQPLSLPRDLYTHDWAQTEWWYYTGHLRGDDGKNYGFELTFFRYRVDPRQLDLPAPEGVTGYMSNFAVLTENPVSYRHDNRIILEGPAAGGAADRYRVFVGDWSVEGDDRSQRLRAANLEMAIDLVVEPDKDYVLHGPGGIFHKSDGLGNYYFSNPRMKARGTLKIKGRSVRVEGMAWFDREFGFLGPAPAHGWDWFSLQLDDRTEYMIYRLHRRQGDIDPNSRACRIDLDSHEECVPVTDAQMTPLTYWKSPHTGGNYPVSWKVKIEQLGLDVTIVPVLPDQELHTLGVTYWEGSCKVMGQPANGRAYLELVGYGRAPLLEFTDYNPRK